MRRKELKKMSVAQWFWAKVDIRGDRECWLWLGSLNAYGYGQLYLRGRHWASHRLAYSLTKGDIPNGLIVRHACDCPQCVNPTHLLLGTMRDNTRDMFMRGRANTPQGERHGKARLTDDVVLKVRAAQARGENEQSIAKLLGIDKKLAHSACVGWKHVQVKS